MNKKATKTDIKNTNTTNPDVAWITDKAWLSAVVAIICVLTIAFWFSAIHAFTSGVYIGEWHLTNKPIDSILFALIVTIGITAICESVRTYLFDKKKYFHIDPDLIKKNYIKFFSNCLIKYVEALLVLFIVLVFFRTAGEYGFKNHAPYYQPWFRLLDIIWTSYLWLGLPYIIVTRATHADTKADLESLSLLSKRLGGTPSKHAPLFLRNCVLRMFFTPLACIFFADQFSALVNAFEYMTGGLSASIQRGAYRHETFNKDLVQIALSLILCIHMAIASCGYLCMSRWLKNTIKSCDPSFVGWIVCLMSFPPFNIAVTWYFFVPGERDFLTLHSDTFVSLLSIVLIALYLIYLSATLCFGGRFSNLTNRGIIRTGPYRWVRHPAYSAYITGSWIVGIPVIVSQIQPGGWGIASSLFIGLCINTWVYYLRAITEEKHLYSDTRYQEYYKNTPRRFIPKLF